MILCHDGLFLSSEAVFSSTAQGEKRLSSPVQSRYLVRGYFLA